MTKALHITQMTAPTIQHHFKLIESVPTYSSHKMLCKLADQFPIEHTD